MDEETRGGRDVSDGLCFIPRLFRVVLRKTIKTRVKMQSGLLFGLIEVVGPRQGGAGGDDVTTEIEIKVAPVSRPSLDKITHSLWDRT